MSLNQIHNGVFLSFVSSPSPDEREVVVQFGSLKTSTHPDTGQQRTRFTLKSLAIVTGAIEGAFTRVSYNQDINSDGVLNQEDEAILLEVATAFAKIKSDQPL